MKNYNKIICHWQALAMTIMVLFSNIAYADVFGGKPGDFATWGTGGRTMALGNAGAIGKKDSFSFYYNSAFLADIQQREVGFFQSSLWENTNYTYLSYVYPMLDKGCLGFSLIQLASNGALKTDEKNTALGTFGLNQIGLGASYGKNITPRLAFGMTAKYLNSSLDSYSQNYLTIDSGLYTKINPYIDTGISLQNLIPFSFSDTQDELPMVLRLCFGFKIIPGYMAFYTDFIKNSGTRNIIDTYSIGLEITPSQKLAVRLGKNKNEITAGFGLRVLELGFLDYAYSVHDELGSSHKISMSYQFGDIIKIKKPFEEIEAGVTAEQLSASDQQKYQDTFQEASDAYERGLYKKAADKFNEVRLIDPTDHDVAVYVDRLNLVIKVLPQCISPGKSNDLLRRGINYYIEGNGENAVKTIAYASSLEPENFAITRLLSKIEEDTKIRAEKLQPVEGMSLIDQKLYEVLVSFRQKNYSKVIELCKEILLLEPDNVLAYKRLGSAFFALGDKPKAVEMWKKALEFGPDPKLEQMIKSIK